MTTVVVSATYTNGASVIPLPDGWSASDTWLLFNGQVWAGSSLVAGDTTITVPGIDLSGELIQLTDVAAGSAATSDSTLTSISTKLDALLASASSTTTTTSQITLPSASTLARINASAARKQSQGMNAKTGRLLTGLDHLQQSIADILHTRIGSRVMRRTYGSNLFERIDRPQTETTKAGVIADIAEALSKWEPRFLLKQVKLTGTAEEQNNGKLFCTLIGRYNGAEISVGVPA